MLIVTIQKLSGYRDVMIEDIYCIVSEEDKYKGIWEYKSVIGWNLFSPGSLRYMCQKCPTIISSI